MVTAYALRERMRMRGRRKAREREKESGRERESEGGRRGRRAVWEIKGSRFSRAALGSPAALFMSHAAAALRLSTVLWVFSFFFSFSSRRFI